MKVLLLALILNGQTGEPQGMPTVKKEFDTIEACMKAKAGTTLPKVDKKSGIAVTVVVYTCAVPPGMAIPAAPVEPIVIDEDDTKATT